MIVKLKMPAKGKICKRDTFFSKYVVCDQERDGMRHNSVMVI